MKLLIDEECRIGSAKVEPTFDWEPNPDQPGRQRKKRGPDGQELPATGQRWKYTIEFFGGKEFLTSDTDLGVKPGESVPGLIVDGYMKAFKDKNGYSVSAFTLTKIVKVMDATPSRRRAA